MSLYRSGRNRGDDAVLAVKASYGQVAANAIDAQLASLASTGNDSSGLT